MKAASLAGGGAIERRRLAFAALSATNEAILRSSNAEEMLQKVTEAAVDGGGFLGAAIFLALSIQFHDPKWTMLSMARKI